MAAAPGGRAVDAALARLGLVEADAIPALRATNAWSDAGPVAATGPMLSALVPAANPDLALATLARIAERAPKPFAQLIDDQTALHRAVVVAGCSEPLGTLLVRDPDALEVLSGDLAAWDAGAVAEWFKLGLRRAEEDPAIDTPTLLATFHRRSILRIAARDLLGIADTPTATAELADLAEGIMRAVTDHVVRQTEGDIRLAVIGMGKLGGRELNYISDVDVMFVYEGDWGQATRAIERFLRLLGQVTPAGQVYEIDTALRPEGADGPLARSLDAYRNYYDRWAKTWEFQALLKARPVAGDAELGRAFTGVIEPFLWPDELGASVVDEIQRLKGVVEESRPVKRARGLEMKLGPGGLRDIEFAVQLLQLVHGRHDPTLRTPNTLEGLTALAEGGYIDDGDANLFGDDYIFLRTVEHRIQLLRFRRSHTVPADDEERHRIARAVGFRRLRSAGALEQFDRELARVQAGVRRLHEKLFYRPLLDRFAQVTATDRLAIEGAGELEGLAHDAARDRLAALGFVDPEGALRDLDALARGVSRSARLFRMLLPAVLPTLAAAPDPDGGLTALRSLNERLSSSPYFLRTLRDSPPVADLLAQVLGRSTLVGEWLARQPEVIGGLSDLEALGTECGTADYCRRTDGLQRRNSDAEAGLRRLKRREIARTAVRDLTDRADVLSVARELSSLAEACLDAAVKILAGDDVRLAVIGVGKLGGRELSYASDLDVLFVAHPSSPRDAAEQVGESLLKLLSSVTPEGQAFRVDPNLRPEGKDGPLVRSLDSYRAYYDRWGEAWEFQALTQARHVAGDAEVAAEFMHLQAELVYPGPASAQRLLAVRKMKARVEAERGSDSKRRSRLAPRSRPRPGRHLQTDGTAAGARGERLDLKMGEGGLADVDWTVQLLQLRHGSMDERLRVPGTLAALGALTEAGIIDEQDAAWLREGWLLQSTVRNALYLAGQRDTSRLPGSVVDQEMIAALMGFARPGAQALLEELGRVRRRIRRVHERLFYDAF